MNNLQSMTEDAAAAVDFSEFLTIGAGVAKVEKRDKPLSDVLSAVATAVNVALQRQGMATAPTDILAAQCGDTFVGYVRSELHALAEHILTVAGDLTTDDIMTVATHDGTSAKVKVTGMGPERVPGVFAQANVSVTVDPKSTLGDALRKSAPREAKPQPRKK